MEKSKNNKKGIGKTILVMLLVVTIFFLLFGTKLQTAFQIKTDYNKFISYVENGSVESVDIDYGSGKVTFKLINSNTEYYTNYPHTETFEETLLKNNIDVKIHEKNLLLTILPYAISPVLLIIAFIYLSKGSVFDFDIEPVHNNTTKFDDIAGLSEIKEDLLTISVMMKEPAYREHGARIPRGILLQGPPGNGKTLLAKAFAGETGVNFIAVNACDFGSQFVGIGSNKIKKVFDMAKENSPCVVFIDELDAVGARRGSNSDAASKEMNTMLTALLNQMDGFKTMDNVMVLAATNRVEDLDEALIRPGRFDKQLIIDYPDSATRKEIFELYTKGLILDRDVDFDKLVNKTFGYSSSKIECIVNDAIINSIKRNKDNNVISLYDFDNAILEMDIKGHVKKNVDEDRKEKEIVAYHEAGHAIVAYFKSNKNISSISIVPTTSGAGGFTITEEDDSTLCPIMDYKNRMIMLYGGRAAETKLKGSIEMATAGASQDIREATKIATQYSAIKEGIDYSEFGEYGVKEVMHKTEDILHEVWKEALLTIETNWDAVGAVANRLMIKETINSNEFMEIIKEFKGDKN